MRRRRVVAGLLLTSLLTPPLSGCAQSVDPIERLGKKAAQKVDPRGRPAAPPPYRRWGLTTPLARPPRPSAIPPVRTAGPGLPPAVDHIRTRDKVVFLTYDYDVGVRRDPRFADMVRELRIPVTLFVTDTLAAQNPADFERLRAAGAGVQNQTLDHPPLRGLPYSAQRTRICGRQTRLHTRFGTRPHLFRPPYGTYDTTTLRAAADCGVGALVLWRASMTSGTLTYAGGDHHLHPGDIVQVGPAGTRGPTLRSRTARLLRRVQREGLTVGRLEDYL